MRVPFIYYILVLVGLFTFQSSFAQEFPRLDSSPLDISIYRNEDLTPVIRVIYSRPQKKNREIFGKLVPYGKVWRTGANEATEIDIYEPLLLDQTVIQPGTYTLYSIPHEKEWVIIFNQDTNVWGAYNYDESKDVLRVSVSPKKAAAPIESLSMAFMPTSDGVSLMIGWDDRYVEVPFKKVK